MAEAEGGGLQVGGGREFSIEKHVYKLEHKAKT